MHAEPTLLAGVAAAQVVRGPASLPVQITVGLGHRRPGKLGDLGQRALLRGRHGGLGLGQLGGEIHLGGAGGRQLHVALAHLLRMEQRMDR